MSDAIWPGDNLISITPHNTTEFAENVRMVYVGTGGSVSVTTTKDATVTFTNVPSGSTIGPFFIKRVNATGTTASGMIGFY